MRASCVRIPLLSQSAGHRPADLRPLSRRHAPGRRAARSAFHRGPHVRGVLRAIRPTMKLPGIRFSKGVCWIYGHQGLFPLRPRPAGSRNSATMPTNLPSILDAGFFAPPPPPPPPKKGASRREAYLRGLWRVWPNERRRRAVGIGSSATTTFFRVGAPTPTRRKDQPRPVEK